MATPTPTPTPTSGPLGWVKEIGHDVEAGVIDIKSFVSDVPKVFGAWKKLSPQVMAVGMQLIHDVGNALDESGLLAIAAESGNIPGAITLSGPTWQSFKQIYADAKAGDEEILASLKVAGVNL